LDKTNLNEGSKNIETTLNISISDDYYIRLLVNNKVGLSEPSGPFKLVRKEISIKIRASSITIAIIIILSIAAIGLILTTILFTM
jgi:hypothetical protein